MSGDPETFWPQSWLPKEAGLENVNTYTFGYDSDWASSKASILDVNDFGQALLEDMRNAPNLRDSGEVSSSLCMGLAETDHLSDQSYYSGIQWEVSSSRK